MPTKPPLTQADKLYIGKSILQLESDMTLIEFDKSEESQLFDASEHIVFERLMAQLKQCQHHFNHIFCQDYQLNKDAVNACYEQFRIVKFSDETHQQSNLSHDLLFGQPLPKSNY